MMMHPLIERATFGYRTAIEKQIEQFAKDAVGNIAIHESTTTPRVTLRIDDKNHPTLQQLTKPDYYALIVNGQYGIFVCPVVAMRMSEDGTTRGWITLDPNEIEKLARASSDDTDGTLYDHLAELHELHPLDRVLDDEVYDDETDLSIVSLEHVEFTMATRLVPLFGTTYDYFELSDGRSTYREYPYSYIIITSKELSGIYSTVDL
jgi:hypothetical protein